MPASVDSEPVFSARCVEIGMDAALLAALIASGIDTMGKFAFASSYMPGQDETPLIAMLEEAGGQVPTLFQKSVCRRLAFESHALVIEDTKFRLEKPVDALPRKMALAERASRYRAQAARLVGISLVGENDPSHQLLDLVAQQAEENLVKFIPLSHCTRRDAEITNVKTDSSLRTDANGHLIISKEPTKQFTSISTDLLVMQAMTRRALAYDQLGLVCFEVGSRWIRHLFQALNRDAPAGYSNPDIGTLIGADQFFWVRAAEITREGIAPPPTGATPLEKAFEALIADPFVNIMLMPKPSRAPAMAPKAPAGAPRPGGPASTTPKPKPKAKAGKKGTCYKYNGPLGCTYAAAGARCRNGFHLCKTCQGPHTKGECPDKKAT
jgi:hypothetical protein